MHKKLGDLGIQNFDELHRFGVQKESDLAQEKKFFSARPANRNPASGGSNVQVNLVRQPPRAVQFDPFEQPERSSRINAVRQPPRRFSNLGRPLSKVLEKLIEKGMLRRIPSHQPLPNANPKL